MGNNTLRNFIVALFCAVLMVGGSIVMQQCSDAHPIVFDAATGKTLSVW